MKILFFFFSFFKINPSFSDKFYPSQEIQEIILMQIDIFWKIFTPGPRKLVFLKDQKNKSGLFSCPDRSLDYFSDILFTFSVCLFVCYSCGTPESPLPLNPGQGSDSPGEIAATRSISVRGQRSHVPYPRWPAAYVRHVQSRGSVAPKILPPRSGAPRAWGNWYWWKSQTSPSISRSAAYLL